MDVTCACCGRALHADEGLLSWMRDTDTTGETTWICGECTRENVRAIEAKLDQQWW